MLSLISNLPVAQQLLRAVSYLPVIGTGALRLSRALNLVHAGVQVADQVAQHITIADKALSVIASHHRTAYSGNTSFSSIRNGTPLMIAA